MTNLVHGTTYYWATVPYDGRTEGASTPVWNFTVNISYGNAVPTFTSSPPSTAFVNIEMVYQASALDDDGDQLTYSLKTKWEGLSIDSATGLVKWVPRPRVSTSCGARSPPPQTWGKKATSRMKMIQAARSPMRNTPKKGRPTKSPRRIVMLMRSHQRTTNPKNEKSP